MYIDFHTHIFPEKIAGRVLAVLKDNAERESGQPQKAHTDGTAEGLRKSMRENGIDISVALPIATKVTQAEGINRFAVEVNSPDIVSFGSVHPMQDDWESVLEGIADAGLKGIKLHPQYQQVRVDSPEVIRILKKADALKLYTSIHAGIDIGMPPPVMCTPKMLSHVLEEVSGKYIIAAHMGGYKMWDEVEKELVGKALYFDTAFVKGYIDREQYRRIIKNHGSEKILLASDSPWENIGDTIDELKSLGLDGAELDNIMYKNALRILKTEGEKDV